MSRYSDYMWTLAFVVILSLISNGLAAPSPPTTVPPKPDCSVRDELVAINQPSNTSILIDSIQAAYTTWNSSTKFGFNTYYNKIKNVSYNGDNVEDIINELIVVMTQYNFNNPEKRLILWNVTIIGWGGTIKDFIECGNWTEVTVAPSTEKPTTEAVTEPSTEPSTVQSTVVAVCPSSSGPPDCASRLELIFVDPDSNSTILTDYIQAEYETWNSSMRLGFNTYYNKIRKVLYDNNTSEEYKIDELIVIFHQYNFNNHEKRQVLWNIQIECWGTIEDFINCGNSSSGGGSPGTEAPVTPPSGATSQPVSPTSSGPDCSLICSFIAVDPVTNRTILTDSIQAAYETWNSSMKLGFNTYYNKIRKAIWNTTATSEEKVEETIVVFHQYNFNNHEKRQVLWDVKITVEGVVWGTIEDYIKCGAEVTCGSVSGGTGATIEITGGTGATVEVTGGTGATVEVTGGTGATVEVTGGTGATIEVTGVTVEVTGDTGATVEVTGVTVEVTGETLEPTLETLEPTLETELPTEESSPASESEASPSPEEPSTEPTLETEEPSSPSELPTEESSVPSEASPSPELSTEPPTEEPSTEPSAEPSTEEPSTEPSTEESTPEPSSPSTEEEPTTESSTEPSTVTTACVPLTTTSAVCPAQPANTASLILDNGDTQISKTTIPAGTCPASNFLLGVKNYYTSVPDANPMNDIDSASANCNDINQFCMCVESGECFQQRGNSLSTVQFFAFCDGACHTYALVVDALDGSSGLQGDQGTVFDSSTQLDGSGNPVNMGSSSVYLKAASVSCAGCGAIKPPTC